MLGEKRSNAAVDAERIRLPGATECLLAEIGLPAGRGKSIGAPLEQAMKASVWGDQ